MQISFTMKTFLNLVRLSFLFVLLAIVPACNQNKINGTQPIITNTVRVSLSSQQTEGNLDCVKDTPGISSDGRYIAFTSLASNLVPNDTNNAADVFYRDNLNRTTLLVSVSMTGGPANGPSGSPSMSGDGRYVAFSSSATNLTSDSFTPGLFQIYVRDMVAGTTILASRATGTGAIADQNCNHPRISNDGNYVVFDTTSTVLDPLDDKDTLPDVYRRKWNLGTASVTDLISFASGSTSGGTKGNGGPLNIGSLNAIVSQDGRYVAFESSANNLANSNADAGPVTNGRVNVYVRDTMTFRTVCCSPESPLVTAPPGTLEGDSSAATISLDGQNVGFRSTNGRLAPNAQETNPNIYVRFWNGASPFTEVCSVHTSGATGGASCNLPRLCGDGTKVVWQSASTALINGDTNGVDDCFERDRTAQITSRQSVATFGFQLNGESGVPAFSADGRYIVFWSEADNAVDDDTNGAADIFLRGPPFR